MSYKVISQEQAFAKLPEEAIEKWKSWEDTGLWFYDEEQNLVFFGKQCSNGSNLLVQMRK